jgi:hypothetical protein
MALFRPRYFSKTDPIPRPSAPAVIEHASERDVGRSGRADGSPSQRSRRRPEEAGRRSPSAGTRPASRGPAIPAPRWWIRRHRRRPRSNRHRAEEVPDGSDLGIDGVRMVFRREPARPRTPWIPAARRVSSSILRPFRGAQPALRPSLFQFNPGLMERGYRGVRRPQRLFRGGQGWTLLPSGTASSRVAGAAEDGVAGELSCPMA